MTVSADDIKAVSRVPGSVREALGGAFNDLVDMGTNAMRADSDSDTLRNYRCYVLQGRQASLFGSAGIVIGGLVGGRAGDGLFS